MSLFASSPSRRGFLGGLLGTSVMAAAASAHADGILDDLFGTGKKKKRDHNPPRYLGSPPNPQLAPVPGTGQTLLTDDFEDESWSFTPNGQKSSYNIDKKVRLPGGISSNRMWAEAALRGQPDIVKRVPTPPGGPAGSTGSMLLQTLHPGVPGKVHNDVQQDDFLMDSQAMLGGMIPMSWSPNCVCRIYAPAFTQWERREGNTFGMRAGLRATHDKPNEETDEMEPEEYWPGMFVHFRYGAGRKPDSACIMVRSDVYGRDMQGPEIKEKTWYTIGLSFTPDGSVHYFFREGLDDLKPENRIASQYPYGYRAIKFEAMFFNNVVLDTGRTWSTPWVVDNASLCAATMPPGAFQTIRLSAKP